MHALCYIKSLDIYINVHMDTYMYVTSSYLVINMLSAGHSRQNFSPSV